METSQVPKPQIYKVVAKVGSAKVPLGGGCLDLKEAERRKEKEQDGYDSIPVGQGKMDVKVEIEVDDPKKYKWR